MLKGWIPQERISLIPTERVSQALKSSILLSQIGDIIVLLKSISSATPEVYPSKKR